MNKQIIKLSVLFLVFISFIGILYAIHPLIIPASYTAVEYGLSSSPPQIPFGNIMLGETAYATITLINDGTKDFDSLTMSHTLTLLDLWWMILIIVVLVVILIILLVRRRKKAQEWPGSEDVAYVEPPPEEPPV